MFDSSTIYIRTSEHEIYGSMFYAYILYSAVEHLKINLLLQFLHIFFNLNIIIDGAIVIGNF